MHIRFHRSLRGDYGHARVGDVKLVSKDVGKSLVQRGLAEEVEGPDGDDNGDQTGASSKRAAKGQPAPDAE